MIHTSLSPNTEADDVFLALSLIFRPWKWSNNNTVSVFENKLAHFVDVKNITAVDSGRTALYTILTALGMGAGDEVLLQAYTCVAVPEPVLWSRATPIYVDCTDEYTIDTKDLEKKITSRSKAIIVQHTFGKAAALDEVMTIARKHKLFVIEDCAHALGGTYKNRPLGSIADAAFWSFGRDKCISSVFGGAFTITEEGLYQKAKKIAEQYPLPKNSWVLKQLLHPVILTKAKIMYNFFSLGKYYLATARKFGFISLAVEKTELSGGKPDFVPHRFSPALAALALHQLGKLPRFLEHRRDLAREYGRRLAGLGRIEGSAYDVEHAYLRYTIAFSQEEAVDEVFMRAKKRGIQLGDWYTSVLAPQGVDYNKVGYRPGSCPRAEYFASHTLNLPTHIGVKTRMIDPIIDCIL